MQAQAMQEHHRQRFLRKHFLSGVDATVSH